MTTPERTNAISSLDYYAMQQVELDALERRLAQVRLAHELREQRRSTRNTRPVRLA